MAKYILYRCTSVQIAGKLYKKSDGVVFDTEDPKFVKVKDEIEAAANAGYLDDTSKGSNAERSEKAAIKNAYYEKMQIDGEKAETEEIEAKKLANDGHKATKSKKADKK